MFSWHVGNAVTDTRWGDDVVGGKKGNLFKAAVFSVKDTHPNMPIYLFTNGKIFDEYLLSVLTIVEVDLAKHAGFDRMHSNYQADAKLGFGTKLQAVLTGDNNFSFHKSQS